MRRLAVLHFFVVALTARPAFALSVGDSDELLSLELHGFVSQGFIYSTDNNYLANSTDGSFELTEVGLNVTKQITNDLRMGVQLFSRDLGPLGNYSIKADWFYLDYRFFDWLGVRAGRTKIPFGLYNDTSDIDAARVPVLLPQSIYPTANRDFLLAQTGAEVYGYTPIGPLGALDYRVYAGTIFADIEQDPESPFIVRDLSIPYVVGGRLLWETPLSGLRMGGTVQALRLEADFAARGAPVEVSLAYPAILWIASVEYAAHDILVAAEYSRWHARLESSEPAVIPDRSDVSERAMALITYRIADWLHPGLHYSLLYPDVTVRTGRSAAQHDIAVTLRFDLVPDHWLLKLEGHYMDGTAALSSGMNDGTPRAGLTRQWALFLAKTTAYF